MSSSHESIQIKYWQKYFEQSEAKTNSWKLQEILLLFQLLQDNSGTAYVIHYTLLDSEDTFSSRKEEKNKKKKIRKKKKIKEKSPEGEEEKFIGFSSRIRESFLMRWFINH